MNEKLLAAHHKIVRVAGNAYRIISLKLGSKVLADAENIKSGDLIPLVNPKFKTKAHATRVNLGAEILNAVNMGLVS
jgi:hypothetical protein